MSDSQDWMDAIPENSTCPLVLDGVDVLLCNSGGTHYAVENRCTHQDTPLHKGRLRHGHICCPLHGVRFDLETGEPKGNLTRIPVRTFPVETDGGRVRIIVSDSD